MRDGSYVIVDRLCEATTQMLEIIRKQEEIIEQCRISDELHKELDDMKNDVDQKMDLIEYDKVQTSLWRSLVRIWGSNPSQTTYCMSERYHFLKELLPLSMALFFKC